MKSLYFGGHVLVTGKDSMNWISSLTPGRVFLVTGGGSMIRTGVLDRIEGLLPDGSAVLRFTGIGKNPTKQEVEAGIEEMKAFRPDTIIAVGGGSAIDAAKAMMLFYEHPELSFDNVQTMPLPDEKGNILFIAIPSTSGTASEVTHVSVITYPELEYKIAIRCEAIRPAVAILDPALPMTLPARIAAETGMDALTHALECFINTSADDFTEALAKEAAEGIMEWLPASCLHKDPMAREKVHNYQCMAGLAFSNAGLGMVHGIAHAFGGKYNLAHGLCNAIVLPYSIQYNGKDPRVRKQYDKLAKPGLPDIAERVFALGEQIGIPQSFRDAGLAEKDYLADFGFLLEKSMGGSTRVNPVPVPEADMAKFLDCIYYGEPVTF
ncbi:MAG: iron-containing alcohol dehydrogenase [Clostridia bacterium]|nr:iron-containing alcohol dehydrogenase [Clostridia bacterium]